ncbi:mediator complex, subunit Med5 [Pyronema omphalodes]|nr:mediator complex, subunit Med5 [Pyronema omphalodes]
MTTPIAIDYKEVFKRCLERRMPVDSFENTLNQLLLRNPSPPEAISANILDPILGFYDPLHVEYIGRLVERDVVSVANILVALLKTSAVKGHRSSTAPDSSMPFHSESEGTHGRVVLEQNLFLRLAHVLNTQKARSAENVWAAVQAMCEWMEAVMAVLGDGGDDGIPEAMDMPSKFRLEALGQLVIALGTNESAMKVMSEPGRKDKKLNFQSSLSLFTQYVQVQNPELGHKLEVLRHQYRSQSPRQQRQGLKDSSNEIDGMVMGLGGDSVEIVTVMENRAHLFIWLESLLCARPHVDDDVIFGYLYARYKDRVDLMVPDFITAVIDVISNAIIRHEPSSTLFLLRSFLCNKVPLIINRISPSPMDSSLAISKAFQRTDATTLTNLAPSIFDPYSYNTNRNPDIYDITVDLRPDFLFACALHNVIVEQDINGLLGELPLGAMSAAGTYYVPDLMLQCVNDPARIDRLLEEIEAVEGNSGAVVQTIFEQMKNMCESRETMPLRNICSYLARKPSSMDVMLLFIKPAEILEPLCDLLDNWRYEEDQGEYQPVYEEFGYILLLVLTVIKRYSLTLNDLAFSHPVKNESFIAQLLRGLATAKHIEDLTTSDSHAQLGGWIKELYEGEGISDELMMSCRPQDFYLLAPTIFSQSMIAIQRSILDLDTVKEALAFLLTPFLLPSVIPGLSWLTTHLWTTIDSNPYPTLAVLSALVMARDLSAEASETHRTVLSISAQSLDSVLRQLSRRPNISQEVASLTHQLISTLKPHLRFIRDGISSNDELQSWIHNTSSGGLAQVVANLYACMFQWAVQNPGEPQLMRPPTTVYTHRVLLQAHRLLGARTVVDIIVREASLRSSMASPGVAEDIAAAMLGSYVPDDGNMTFYDALQDNNGNEIMDQVRRRVEIGRRGWSGQGLQGVQHQDQEVNLQLLGDVDMMMMQGGFDVGDDDLMMGM